MEKHDLKPLEIKFAGDNPKDVIAFVENHYFDIYKNDFDFWNHHKLSPYSRFNWSNSEFWIETSSRLENASPTPIKLNIGDVLISKGRYGFGLRCV